MSLSWTRPKSVEFPKVYLRFETTDRENDGSYSKYHIEDLQENRFDEVISIMKYKHLNDEPMYSSKRIREDPTSFQEMATNWTNMLKQCISIVCFKEGSDDIIAVSWILFKLKSHLLIIDFVSK